jgi:YgiT-type zinc finger domain-containing protein
MSDSEALLCPQCQIGHLQPGRQTYVRVHGDMVISVPDMPALTCDVCGYHEFEQHALIEVEALVSEAKRPVSARSTPKAPPTAEANPPSGLKP